MPSPDGWSNSSHKNWVFPLVVMLGASVYSWRVRKAEAKARREKFEQHLGEPHRRDSAVAPATEDSIVSHVSSPSAVVCGEEKTVPPVATFCASPSKTSLGLLAGAASLERYDSVVLSLTETHDMSIRLFPESLSGAAHESSSFQSVTYASVGRRTANSVGRSVASSEGRVQVGALTLHVRADFVEQPTTYSFPVMTCSFVHPDGSRLYIMAEEMTAAREVRSTTQYVTQSLDRLRNAAQLAKTYFKVKLNTAASMIVTTILERYVSIHIGPSPSIVIGFFLVHKGVAYTIQLQCQPEEYESRLADVLMAVQTARIDPDATPEPRGHNCYTLRIPTASQAGATPSSSLRTYVVHLPTELIVHQNPSDPTTLLLTHAHSTTWCGEVRAVSRDEVAASSSAASTDAAVTAFVPLIENELYLYLNPRSASDETSLLSLHAILAAPATTWAELVATEPSATSSATTSPTSARNGSLIETRRRVAPPCFYVSPQMRLPLPPVHQFTTQVCEHLGDRGVTLFIRECAGDLFEMELRIIVLREEQLPHFTAAIDTFFLSSVRPHPTINTAGQRIISAEGLASAGGEVTLRLDCVQVNDDHWLIIRWLFDDSNIFTRELEQYKERLYDTVFV